ncbi:glutathione S-transferase [Marasmius fiardii PR-910]|nr:glutathione S-transferase [Marasmius fiardii PR-910]
MSKVTLYSNPTPNGVVASIFLEELGIDYEAVRMSISDADIGKVHNQVKSDWYLEINPNGRIPAITHNGFNVFETSAILLYLQAEFDKENKFGFSPTENPKEYSQLLQWLFFAHGGVGPMQGQANHFSYIKEKIPYAQNRYINETKRLYGVLERQLSKHEYLVGDKYTVADIKTFGWVRRGHALGIDVGEWPGLKAWLDRIESRPAVQKGVTIPPAATL